jgi:hypothetical protein
VSSKGNSREDDLAYWCSREESVLYCIVLAGCMASVWEEGGGRKGKQGGECSTVSVASGWEEGGGRKGRST